MKVRTRPNYGILAGGLILTFVFGTQLLMLYLQRDDIWWTPETKLVNLSDSANRVDVYMKNERLVDLLDGHMLWVGEGDDLVAVSNNDIGFRFNNWDKVQASQIPQYVGNLPGLFIGLIALIYWLVQLQQYLLYKKKA
jgi:hypothetical protein